MKALRNHRIFSWGCCEVGTSPPPWSSDGRSSSRGLIGAVVGKRPGSCRCAERANDVVREHLRPVPLAPTDCGLIPRHSPPAHAGHHEMDRFPDAPDAALRVLASNHTGFGRADWRTQGNSCVRRAGFNTWQDRLTKVQRLVSVRVPRHVQPQTAASTIDYRLSTHAKLSLNSENAAPSVNGFLTASTRNALTATLTRP
jgi:hypothetical protein